MGTHDAPATLDDHPTLLKISESVGWQTDAAGPGTIGLKSVCKKNAGAEQSKKRCYGFDHRGCP
jgi:hypothetical protein